MPRRKEEANTEIAQMFAEMERLNALVRTDLVEIARLNQETDVCKAEVERWKIESARQKMELSLMRQQRRGIARETRLILDRLKTN